MLECEAGRTFDDGGHLLEAKDRSAAVEALHFGGAMLLPIVAVQPESQLLGQSFLTCHAVVLLVVTALRLRPAVRARKTRNTLQNNAFWRNSLGFGRVVLIMIRTIRLYFRE